MGRHAGNTGALGFGRAIPVIAAFVLRPPTVEVEVEEHLRSDDRGPGKARTGASGGVRRLDTVTSAETGV